MEDKELPYCNCRLPRINCFSGECEFCGKGGKPIEIVEDKELQIAGLKASYIEALILLKEALYFMNQVPNNKYYVYGGSKNHYEFCNRVEKYLNIGKNELPTM